MSDQGRRDHPLAFLDWAWWNGLVGLIMTIICVISIIGLLVYMNMSTSSHDQMHQEYKGYLKSSSISI